MACGTPVIGSAVGGIKSTVRHEETGYLVPPKNPEALANRLAELLGDPARLAQFSEQALERAEAYYTWRRVVDDIAEIYDDICVPQRPKLILQTPWRSPRPLMSTEGYA
jgi:glycosyltransferase involved in cell wall biosynthesis